METIKGQEVSEEQIAAWAAEAEAGYDVAELKKRGRPSLGSQAAAVIPVRIDKELLDALNARAEAKHLNRSEAIREAVQAWVVAA